MKYLLAAIIYLFAISPSMASKINGDSDFYPRDTERHHKKAADKPVENKDLWQRLSEQEQQDLEKAGIYNAGQLPTALRESLEKSIEATTPPTKKNNIESDNPFRQKR